MLRYAAHEKKIHSRLQVEKTLRTERCQVKLCSYSSGGFILFLAQYTYLMHFL